MHASTEILVAQRTRAVAAALKLAIASQEVEVWKKEIKDIVREHTATRNAIFKQRLEDRGLTWCNDCHTVFLPGLDTYSYRFVEGVREANEFSGFNATPKYEEFGELKVLCETCRGKTDQRHGQKDAHTHFYAFRVLREQDTDRLLALKFNVLVKLEGGVCVRSEPPFELVERYAKEFELEPRLTLAWSSLGDETSLITHFLPSSSAA